MKEEKYGYIDRSGTYVIEPVYDVAGNFNGGVARVKKDGEWSYIGRNRATVPEPAEQPESEVFNDGLAPREKDGKFGYANSDGDFVIEPQFFRAEPFCEGLARVLTGPKAKWMFINTEGKAAFRAKFSQAEDFCGGLARVCIEEYVEV